MQFASLTGNAVKYPGNIEKVRTELLLQICLFLGRKERALFERFLTAS